MWHFVKSHATSISSYVAAGISATGALLASGAIASGSTLYTVLGTIVCVGATLGFKTK